MPKRSPFANFCFVYDGETTTTEILKRIFGDSRDAIWVRSCDYNVEKYITLTPVFIRCAGNETEKKCAELVQLSKPYIYFLDDNFWLLYDQTPLGRFYSHPTIRKSLSFIIGGASRVVCNTERLRSFLLHFNADVVVLPAFFDFSCIDEDCEVMHTQEFRIGLVTNSSKNDDILMVWPGIKGALDKLPQGYVLEIFGDAPLEITRHPKVRSLGTVSSYSEFLKKKQSRAWRLGLAPLSNSQFSEYKTNNKFREFSALKIPAIYSDVHVYRNSVIDGVDGWLCENINDSWQTMIQQISQDGPALSHVANKAHSRAKKEFSLEVVRNTWIQALSEFSTIRNYLVPAIKKFFYKKRLLEEDFSPYIFTNSVDRRLPSIWEPVKPYFLRQALFHIEPHDAIRSTTHSPVGNSFCWNFVIATYTERPLGNVAITVRAHPSSEILAETKITEIHDNMSIQIEANFGSHKEVSVCLQNHANLPLGIYLMSPTGNSSFSSTGNVLQGQFFG